MWELYLWSIVMLSMLSCLDIVYRLAMGGGADEA